MKCKSPNVFLQDEPLCW